MDLRLLNNKRGTLTARHPLLEEIWIELKKIHPGQSRKQIYNSHKGPSVPKSTCEAYRYHAKGSEDPLFERIPFACNDELETEMERFLRNIYNLEDHYANRVQTQAAIDSVGKLLNSASTKIIGRKLQESLDYLQEKFNDIGLFVIIPNISNNKPILFTDFSSFKDDFLRRARIALRLEEIPKFYFRCTGYIDTINEIRNTANLVSICFIEKERMDLNFEMALSAVYDCGRSFELIHAEPYTSATTSVARSSSGGKATMDIINSKKAFDDDALRNQVIKYVDNHKTRPDRSINLAAKELAKYNKFPCSKTIKAKFKAELEPMRNTKYKRKK